MGFLAWRRLRWRSVYQEGNHDQQGDRNQGGDRYRYRRSDMSSLSGWCEPRHVIPTGRVCATPCDSRLARLSRSRRRSRSRSVSRYMIATRLMWTTPCDSRSARRSRSGGVIEIVISDQVKATAIKLVWVALHDRRIKRRLRSDQYITCVLRKYKVANF